MTLYQELVHAGLPVSSWQSDLYVEVTDVSRDILSRHPVQKSNATRFTSQTDGKPMFDVPFAFDPYWETRLGSPAGRTTL